MRINADFWNGYLVAIVVQLLIHFVFIMSAHSDTIESMIAAEAKKAGIEPEIAIAVARVESGLNQNARGQLGEVGLFQVRPQYASHAIYLTRGNIQEGVRMLHYWKQHCPVAEYVICYNSGRRHPRYPQLHPYYKRVKAAMYVKLP